MAKKKKNRVPEIVEHAVAAVMRDEGVSREKAYKIVVGRFQRLGILKRGTLDLTERGKRLSGKHYKEPKKTRLRKVRLARKHKKKKL